MKDLDKIESNTLSFFVDIFLLIIYNILWWGEEMIKIAKFDEKDYETYKDFVNSIKNSLEPNGELYAFEYERVQGYVYKIHDSFDIFI